MLEQTYTVVGMTCEHCVHAVEQEVAGVPGVASAHADLDSGRLVVRGDDVDARLVRAAVDDAGYATA